MDIRLPSLGEGVDQGVVANVLVKEGDEIRKDQPILELESEKAVASIPSPSSGKVTQIHIKMGDTVKVGQLILSLAGPATESQEIAEKRSAERAQEPLEKISEKKIETHAVLPEGKEGNFPPPAAPSVRKRAQELGIDLAKVRGSEKGGRIVLADLKAHINELQALAIRAKSVAVQAPKAPPEIIDFSQWGPIQKKKMTQLRGTIARKMTESWTTIPHVTQFDEADITDLSELRKKYTESYQKKGIRLTLTPILLKAVVHVLKKYPIFNSSLDEANEELILKDYYHFGIAVDTEGGLIVPVLRDVDKRSLLELSKDLEALAEKTRTRKITIEELRGGTFTLSNQGGIGGAHFTPIVNKPEVAILGLGRGALKPVIKNGSVASRLMLPLCLSYDHRVIDGADAARFIHDLVQTLEQFKEEEIRFNP